MTDLYDERIDAMRALERDNIELLVMVLIEWAERRAGKDKRNTERLAAYHVKRWAYMYKQGWIDWRAGRNAQRP